MELFSELFILILGWVRYDELLIIMCKYATLCWSYYLVITYLAYISYVIMHLPGCPSCGSQWFVSRSTKSHIILYKGTALYGRKTKTNKRKVIAVQHFLRNGSYYNFRLFVNAIYKKYLIRGDYVGIVYLFCQRFLSRFSNFNKMPVIWML